jgi:geranylgeranyl diphosphate synthase, type II
MDDLGRIERALSRALEAVQGSGAPPLLGHAMHHAVFPRGARVRPRLCLAVAAACGDDAPALTDAAAAAIELLHCASLVHDDLPCFDDADTRRGRPSVHAAFGERLAVLAGDALIVLAFQTAAGAATPRVARLPGLIGALGAAVGTPGGICAGQAWECEPAADLHQYHAEKTGALFAGACMAGAASAGAEPGRWRALGEWLGEAYQVADDISDACAEADEAGKPIGRDAALDRPSAVRRLGVEGAVAHLGRLTESALGAVPDCPGAEALRALVRQQARHLLPKRLSLPTA